MLNGFTTDLPTDVILDSGVVFDGTSAIGAIVGGVRFDPGKEIRNVEYDGKRSNVQGLDRVVGWDPMLAFTMIEFGDTTSGDQVRLLEGGSTNATTGHQSTLMGTIKTFTPKAAGSMYAAGDYLTNIRVLFERTGGGYAEVHFPIALCTKWDLAGADKNEAKVNVEMRPRLSQADAAASPGKCPYEIVLRSKLPS